VRRAAAVAAAAVLTSCGSAPADLFSVDRSGAGPGARLSMVVSDAGTVTCNRGKPVPLPAKELLRARELARDVSEQAELALELPPGPPEATTFRYRAEVGAGTVAWADSSPELPKSFVELAAFTRTTARQVCGLKR